MVTVIIRSSPLLLWYNTFVCGHLLCFCFFCPALILNCDNHKSDRGEQAWGDWWCHIYRSFSDLWLLCCYDCQQYSGSAPSAGERRDPTFCSNGRSYIIGFMKNRKCQCCSSVFHFLKENQSGWNPQSGKNQTRATILLSPFMWTLYYSLMGLWAPLQTVSFSRWRLPPDFWCHKHSSSLRLMFNNPDWWFCEHK